MANVKSNLLAEVGEAPDKPAKYPSPADRTVARAHDAKVNATDSWVNGHISTAKHKQIHARADRVIKAKGKL